MSNRGPQLSNRPPRLRRSTALVLVALGTLALAPEAGATFPGENGLIAFGSNGDYLGTNPDRDFEIFTMTPAGAVVAQLTDNVDASDNIADWSPDGSRIAFRSRRDDLAGEIYVMDADGSDQRRLTFSRGVDEAPSWSADGTRIYFHSTRTGNFDLFSINADGTEEVNLTGSGAVHEARPVESPDGRTLAHVRIENLREGPYGVHTMPADGDGTVRKVTDDALQAAVPNWSPDGRRLAFNSQFCQVCLGSDIYTIRRNGGGLRQLTAGFGENLFPFWSPDGEELAFTHSANSDFPPSDIYTTESDGSGSPVNLTNSPDIRDEWPAWQPVPDRD